MKYKNYIKPTSLDEAWELNKKKSNRIVAGNLWLKMNRVTCENAIDLSGLGLDFIRETDEEFIIGAMTTLHDVECHKPLNESTGSVFEEAFKNIVGVQFRNCATIGGSVYMRAGFSDVMTVLLALDAEVELYKTGRVHVSQFIDMAYDKDIVTAVAIKKGVKAAYQALRLAKTDLPVLNCAAARLADGSTRIAVGARPGKAKCVTVAPSGDQPEEIASRFSFGSNGRASEEYRKAIAPVLIKRALTELNGRCCK